MIVIQPPDQKPLRPLKGCDVATLWGFARGKITTALEDYRIELSRTLPSADECRSGQFGYSRNHLGPTLQ